MKKSLSVFLKAVIVLIGIATFVGMIRFPQTEGRAANLDLISIYSDPFIIYIYLATIPFFIGLYQAFKLTSHVSSKTLCNIKYCAMALVAFFVGAEAQIIINRDKSDDIAGGVASGLFIIFVFTAVAILAAVFQRRLAKK